MGHEEMGLLVGNLAVLALGSPEFDPRFPSQGCHLAGYLLMKADPCGMGHRKIERRQEKRKKKAGVDVKRGRRPWKENFKWLLRAEWPERENKWLI